MVLFVQKILDIKQISEEIKMKNSNQNTEKQESLLGKSCETTAFEEFVNISPDDESYTEKEVFIFFDSLKEKNLIDEWEWQNGAETRDVGFGQQVEFTFYMTNEQMQAAGFRNDGLYEEFEEWLQIQWEEYFA